MKVKKVIERLERYDRYDGETEVKIRVKSIDGTIDNWFNIETINEGNRTRTVEVDKIYDGCKIHVLGSTPYITAKFSSKREIRDFFE